MLSHSGPSKCHLATTNNARFTSLAPLMVFYYCFISAKYGLWAVLPSAIRYWLNLTSSDMYWNTSDTGWAKAAWSIFSAWSQGACVFVYKMPQFSPPAVFEVCGGADLAAVCC